MLITDERKTIMEKLSRRQFLERMGASAAICACMPSARACACIGTAVDTQTPIPSLRFITSWDNKDFYEIVRDLVYIVADLQKQCNGLFIPQRDKFIIGVPESFAINLNKVNEFGCSVSKFIRDTWTNSSIVIEKASWTNYMYASVFMQGMYHAIYCPIA